MANKVKTHNRGKERTLSVFDTLGKERALSVFGNMQDQTFQHSTAKNSISILGTCSFICQGTSTRSLQRNLFGLQVKLPPVTTSLTTQR